jgi:hypothetical protein
MRKKLIKGIAYFYFVESYRVDGKVHQRVAAYLGRFKTVTSAHWSQNSNPHLD